LVPSDRRLLLFRHQPRRRCNHGLNRESPRWAAPDRIPPVSVEQLPKLNQFSDVSWIIWKAMHKPAWSSETRLNHLKYFMSVSVTNKETQQILKRALEANHWELSEWPGHAFERMWSETKAILGRFQGCATEQLSLNCRR
jgi:hypothetical protein